MFRTCRLYVCGLTLLLAAPAAAWSQYNSNSYSGYTGNGGSSLNQIALKNAQALLQQQFQGSGGLSSMNGGARIGLGVGESLSSGTKPFANYSPGPAISPYLNLFRVDLGNGGNFNYSTLVEPQLRQQQFNQQQQRQNAQTTRKLQSIAAEAAFNPQGSKELAPTGHQTVFSYTGSYYPPLHQRPKKRAQF